MRSRTMGVTGKKVERSGIGGRARTMAGAGPPDLHCGSRGLPAAYRHPGNLGPHEPCPSGPRVTIYDTIRESVVEAREEGRHSERRVVPSTTWRTLSPFVKAYAGNDAISEYPRKNRTRRSRASAVAQRPGATANAVRQNCSRRMGNRQWIDVEPCLPDVQCAVGLRGISHLLPLRWCRRRAKFPRGAIAYRPKS